MLRGAWKVRVVAEGDRGAGELFVPVGAVSSATLPMQRSLRWILAALALLLVAGAIAIVGASVREGTTRPGIDPTVESVRRGRRAMAIASVLIVGLVSLGGVWWRAAAGDAAAVVYKTPEVTGTLSDPRTLSLTVSSSNTERWAERIG
jgi:ABC-type Fe3+-siderophore transport system permease subunit